MVGGHVCTLVTHVLAVLLLLLLSLLRLLLFHLLSQPQCDCLGHFSYLLLPVVQTAQEANIPNPVFDTLIIFVNKVESSNLLLFSRQSSYCIAYNFSILTMVSVSSSNPFLRFLSMGVLAVIDGLPLISISQGLRLESNMISNP